MTPTDHEIEEGAATLLTDEEIRRGAVREEAENLAYTAFREGYRCGFADASVPMDVDEAFAQIDSIALTDGWDESAARRRAPGIADQILTRAMRSATPPAPSLPAGAADPVAWRPIESAPKDGTPILAWCVHPHARYAGDDKEWMAAVVTQWLDFNGGGWTWHGMVGRFTHWMPLPPPPAENDATSPSAASAGNPATDHVDLSPTTPGSAEGVELREQVARIVDPWPFGIVANIAHTERAAVDREKALAKAGAILDLASPTPTQTGEG